MTTKLMVADRPGDVSELWHRAVVEGEQRARITLGPLLESHLEMVLRSYVRDCELCRIVASDALTSLTCGRSETLVQVAGRCLLIAGLFPVIAQKRNVRVRYYVDVGVGAYRSHASYWSARRQAGYAACSQAAAERFTELVGTLRGMRGTPHVSEQLEALALPDSKWN